VRISFTNMDWVKYGMPVMFCVIVAVLIGGTFLPDDRRPPDVAVRILLLAVIALRVVVWRWLERPLADVVDDLGDALLVRVRGVEERVPLSEVQALVRRAFPRRVELHLMRDTSLGAVIRFLPVGSVVGPNPTLDRLDQRIHDARKRTDIPE
jgi:hypothetical protein